MPNDQRTGVQVTRSKALFDRQTDLPGPVFRARASEIEHLYIRYFEDLVANVRKSFGSGPPEPEDVVQSAFEKFAKLEDRTTVRNPRSFLYIAARNIVLDHKRSSKVADAYIAEQLALDSEFLVERITPERVVEARARFDALVKAMTALPQKQQVILTMSRLEGKSYREIHEETGWSMGDISRQMNLAISSLVRTLRQRQVMDDTEAVDGGHSVTNQ